MKFKKLFAAGLALAISCGAVQTAAFYSPESFSAVAEEQDYTEVEENGIKYNVYSDHAMVKGASGKIEGELIIPDKINDVPVTSIGYYAFNMNDLITSVKIPYGVKKIYSDAFRSCRNLESVVLPDSVIVIESGAFSYCFKLESIVIPDNLEEINVSVFTSTPWLSKKREDNPLVIVNNILIDGQTCNGRVEVPNNVKTIEYGAFGDNKSVTSIIIPESVINVKSAFSCCENLDSITFYNKNVLITDDAKTICNFVQTDKIKQETKYTFTGTIYGYEGSTAQAYAEKYGYKFEVLEDEPETTTTQPLITTTTTYQPENTTTTTTTTTSDDDATTVTTTANTKDFYFSIIDTDGKSDGKAKPGEVLQFSLIVDAGDNTCAGIDAQYDLGGLELVQMGKKAEALGGASLTSNPETARFSVMSVSDTTGEPTAVTNGESVSIIKVRVPEDAENGDYFLISLVADQLHVFKEGGTGDKYTTGITGYGLTVYTDNPVTTITTTVPSAPGGTTTTGPAVPGTTSVPAVALTTTSTTAPAANPVTTTKPVTAEKALGDFTGDGKIDAVDASNILAKYAATSTGGAAPTADELAAGDVNKDGKIDAVDASKVLAYYAYKGSGGDKDFHEYLLS